MKTDSQISTMLKQYQTEYNNLKPIFEDKSTWFKGEKFMQATDAEIRATAKEYTDLCDRMCKFAGAIAVMKIILDEPITSE